MTLYLHEGLMVGAQYLFSVIIWQPWARLWHTPTPTPYGLGAYVSQPNPETEGPPWAGLTIV